MSDPVGVKVSSRYQVAVPLVALVKAGTLHEHAAPATGRVEDEAVVGLDDLDVGLASFKFTMFWPICHAIEQTYLLNILGQLL